MSEWMELEVIMSPFPEFLIPSPSEFARTCVSFRWMCTPGGWPFFHMGECSILPRTGTVYKQRCTHYKRLEIIYFAKYCLSLSLLAVKKLYIIMLIKKNRHIFNYLAAANVGNKIVSFFIISDILVYAMHVKVTTPWGLELQHFLRYLEDYNCVHTSIMDWIQHFQISSQITKPEQWSPGISRPVWLQV